VPASTPPSASVDAVLLVSFGGPEQPDDVMPFLRNVTRGRDIPEDRLRLVADQYLQFGGRSPINDQNRHLIKALEEALAAMGLDLPIYWGNRNWQPYLRDAVADMVADGRKHAVALVTSAYSSYSSCRQYRENIADALDASTSTDGSPGIRIDKVGQFFDEPGFVDPFVDGLREAMSSLASDFAPGDVSVAFTAHSIPSVLASTCRYEDQLRRTAQRVAREAGIQSRWDLVFQSRSGAPHVPWLAPDVNEHIVQLKADGVRAVVTVPIGFLSDHQEVIYDLDFTAANTAAENDMTFMRVATPGTDSRFVQMLGSLIRRHVEGEDTNRCLGAACCPALRRA
jgi:ferrochelatase